jgi:hypothetical protein
LGNRILLGCRRSCGGHLVGGSGGSRRWEALGKTRLEEARLWETRPRVSAAATTSRSGDSEPGSPRRRVRRGTVSAAAVGLGEEEHEEEEVGVGEPAAAERPM